LLGRTGKMLGKLLNSELAPKRGLYSITMCYNMLFTVLGSHSVSVKIFESKTNHVIFDDLGKMSTGGTYINIAIPLNILMMTEQINMSNYLDYLFAFNTTANLSSREKQLLTMWIN
jgi:hypothetical protein